MIMEKQDWQQQAPVEEKQQQEPVQEEWLDSAAGAGGGEATDPINEEHGIVHPLPALLSIWDCPMINKIPDLMIMGIHMLGGNAAGAPQKMMGPHQNPFVLIMNQGTCTCIKAHWI